MNEKIIEKATELAKIIKDDPRTSRMRLANLAFEGSVNLKSKLNVFTKERDELMQLISSNAAKEILEPKNASVKALYDEIMSDPVMIEYEAARAEFESILAKVDEIINYEITGQTPPSGCSGNCEGCTSCGH